MDSTSTLVEEREELMVLPSEINNRPITKRTHLLKPHATTIDGSKPFRRPNPSPRVKSPPLCVTFTGWRLPNEKFKSWYRKMSALHKPIWEKSGIFEAIKSSTYRIRKNPSLILSLAQHWSPETNSFVFPWGEATITLEDVTVLLGFSVLGSSVNTPLETSEMKESVEKLERRRKESVKQASWISSFEDDQLEHEGFLVFWLSNFVFPDSPGRSISKDVFNVAVRLARGERLALAPAVLASLYSDLSKVHALAASSQSVNLKSLFKLVQVWIWERFMSVRPEPQLIPMGDKPRIAQWSCLRQGCENVGVFLLDDFDWRPYTKPLRNWKPPRFYGDEAENGDDEFGICVRVSKLEGLGGVIEGYYPNRVAMQFGLAQDLPGLAAKHRPPDVSKQHIRSRLTTASVSAASYREWWMKSVSEKVKEPTETLNASNMDDDDDDDDDDDVPLKVLPLSQIFQKLGVEMEKDEELTEKKRKRAGEDDNENAMDCCQRQDEEEDDDITIAQRIKCRKKCGDVTSGLENVSGLPQKLSYGDEHNSSDPNVASEGVDEKEEDAHITIAQIIKSRKKCDNPEGGEFVYGGLEVGCSVSGLPQKLASGDETVAVPETKQKGEKNDETNFSDALVASNGIAERLKQRKLRTDELALKLEARMLKVEKILAEIKQWKMRENQTNAPISA